MPMFSQTSLRIAYLAIVSLLLPFFTHFVHAQNPEIPALELNKSIEREIAGGQKHEFQIALSENQYARVVVEQRGIDVRVRESGADGKLIAEFDAEIRAEGTETIEIVAASVGIYKLEIEAKQKNAPAARYEIRLTEIRTADERDKSLQEAKTLLTESAGLSRAGKYKEALSLAERALEIREKVLGPEDPLDAQILSRMGTLTSNLYDDEKAENFFKRALGIYEKKLGEDALDIAEPLNNLAVLYKRRGDFVEAEAGYRRVLAIRERALGTNHTLVAAVFNNLGNLYRIRGDFAKSEQMYRRGLEIRERALGADHPDVALVLSNLAGLSYFKGDYAAALQLNRRALEIREKNFGADHPDVAITLNNMGLEYSEKGEPEKAEPLLQRALEIIEKKLGRDDPKITPPLNNLAELYFNQGNFAKAEPLFERALQIIEKNTGDDFAIVSLYLNNLGALYTMKGDYERAEPLLKRALELREKALGAEHFDVGRTCELLARLYIFKGDTEEALKYQMRANRINEKNIALNIVVGTEHQKLSYMSLMAEDLNQTIALQAMAAQKNPVAIEQAATTILQRKGRVLDAMTDNLTILRRRFDAQDQILLERLNDANAQLAELALSQPQDGNLAEYQKRIATLQEQKDKFEDEISRRSAGFYQRQPQITLGAVRNLIPAGAALIEFANYRPIGKTKEGGAPLGEPRYVAYVIRNNGEVQWAELGAVKEIETQIDAFRQALRDPKSGDVKQLARSLDEKILSPLRPFLSGAEQLLVSPDGALNLIPFEALVDAQGNYLVENYAVSYLTSGRDLLRMQIERESKSKPLVVANPTFGDTMATNGKPKTVSAKTRSITAARDLSGVYFAPLIGTEQEARVIKTIFPEAVFLNGATATETALKQTVAPRILHIATHGFFLEDSPNADLPSAIRGLGGATKTENPLFRSGLALAGANSRNGGSENDGILTALEASGLNLWGTKLVVLSACDTGLGEVRNGEGVYGLRRAFVLAGAETLVMSLWSVSDQVTRELMTGYYKNLKQGAERGEALRRVQLEMLKKPNRQHPFYWASFIQSGNWTNLDGKH